MTAGAAPSNSGTYEAKLNTLKTDAWIKAQEAFATKAIFELRAPRLKGNLNLLTYAGIAAPVIVGAIVLAYGTKHEGLDWLIFIAAGIGVIQVLVFLWSVVSQWPDRLQYALQAAPANSSLSQRYKSLASETPAVSDIDKYENQISF
jgi:mobilome CxxCx(11)CxxC protein